MTALGKTAPSLLRPYASHLASGFFAITHYGFALLGLLVALTVITLTVQPDIRQETEEKLMSWLQLRQSSAPTDRDRELDAEQPAAQAGAALTKEQTRVAQWLSKKYRVALEPLSPLVGEVYTVAQRSKLEPTLILAVMAIESNFNPFAQSAVGAQGLMQVMTRVHLDKYEEHGGKQSALYPLPNLKVGVQVLQDCIARAGSVTGGLRLYVGAGNSDDDSGYADKVLNEQARLYQVAKGKPLPREADSTATSPTPQANPADKVALAKNTVLN